QRPSQFGIGVLPRRIVAQPHDRDKVRRLTLALTTRLKSRVHIRIERRDHAFGQDADDRVRFALQQKGMSQYIRLAAESGLPEPVAQDRCPGTMRTILVLREITPDERLDRQYVEIPG